MCLKRITKRYKCREYKVGIGWKIFKMAGNNSVHSNFQGIKTPFPNNCYLHEKDYRGKEHSGKRYLQTQNYGYGNNKYKYGFHIFTKKPLYSGFERCIRKVKYKGGHTMGIDRFYGKHTIVAKYMKILED